MSWDLDVITRKWQDAWWEAGLQYADRPRDIGGSDPAKAGSEQKMGSLGDARRPTGSGADAPSPVGSSPGGSRPTFFIHFAYPGISGYLHVGHMRGFTYTDVFARYKRQTGHQVLFPAGFHASGIPAVAFAKEVERGEKTEYLLANGYDPERDGPIERLADPRKVVDYFAHVYQHEYWKRFGFLIDERRDCTTIDPGYNRFIQWQFRRLQDLGYLIEKPHYAPFCPVAGPVAVDKSETDIREGGNAEVQEFVALRFRMPASEFVDTGGADEQVVLPCATLRPETVYGVTNIFVHPEHDYELVRVWQDGAVGDEDPSEVWLVSAQGRIKCEWQFERAEALGVTVRGEDIIGRSVTTPVTEREVPIVRGTFVDPLIGTGVVMSVPAHAPFDWAAYQDAGLLEDLGPPPQIIDIEGYDDLPAKVACERHGVKSQEDEAALAAATDEIYSAEFNAGVMNDVCGPYAGKRVKAIKDDLKQDFIEGGHGRIIRQFSETVISRAGELVDVKRIPDQAFIHYADEAWTDKGVAHARRMRIYPQRYSDDIENVLRWFGDRACVRRGAWLGTDFPFKEGWIVEPIADSTFYPWYYLVSPYVADGRLAVEELSDEFFDFVFNGKGKPATPVWTEVRDDVLYWGPVDINLGGKEHQTVHFPVYIMNMVGLMDEHQTAADGSVVVGPDGGPKSFWPRGIFVNWWVTKTAGAKISKSKGGAEPIPGAAKKYGVDPMRLYYCHVGSPHVDIEWDPQIVLTYRQHVERLGRVADDLLAVTGEAGPMDGWLEAAFARTLRTARDAYEQYDLRTAASELVYTVPELLRWYQRRGGAHAALLQGIVQDWAKALCPMVPHVAEEMFQRAGGSGLCSVAPYPDPPQPDVAALAAEEHLRAVLEDVKTVAKLADVAAPERLMLYTAPAWKRSLSAKAVAMAAESDGRFPMGDFMKQVMADPEMRSLGKAVQQFAGRLPQTVNQLAGYQRDLIAQQVDEAALLREAAPFIAAEVGVAEVAVWAADADDAPEHPKRTVAAPLKPGIALA